MFTLLLYWQWTSAKLGPARLCVGASLGLGASTAAELMTTLAVGAETGELLTIAVDAEKFDCP